MRIKMFIFTLFVVFFTASMNLPAAAEPVEWDLHFNEDGSLQERVTFTRGEVAFSPDLWRYTETDGKCIISRNLSSWSDYNSAQEKLPLTVKQQDHFVYSNLLLMRDNQGQDAEMIDADREIKLAVAFPGFVQNSTARESNAGRECWYIAGVDGLTDSQEDLIVRAVIVDGFNLAVSILGAGFIIILLFLVRSIRRVGRIIDEEYSLEETDEE